MVRHSFLTIVLTIILLCSFIKDNKPFEEYEGGRLGYSSVDIKLYSDSTYSYYEWVHTGDYTYDKGNWQKVNEKYFLNSTSTKYKGKHGKAKKPLRFKMQGFIIKDKNLKFIPTDSNDTFYYDMYYSLFRVANKVPGDK